MYSVIAQEWPSCRDHLRKRVATFAVMSRYDRSS
jgi:hypothetical protein